MKIRNILSLILLFFSSALLAQTSTLTGKIMTPQGNPVAAAKLVLVETGKTEFSGVKGTYEFKHIQSGNYTIRIYLAGWQTVEKRILLTVNEKLELNIELHENAKAMPEVLVEGRKGLNARAAGIAKADIAPMDLPQASSIIWQSVMTEQQARRLSDVIKNVNGVYLASTRGATQENFSSRGYSLSSSNMFKDGVRINSGSMPEISSLEKVEILKGSAAILFGNVSPGGIINLVTRQPKFSPGAEISMRTGSYDLYKPAVDFYGPLSHAIAYRLIGTFEGMKSFRDQVHSERYYFNPSMLFKLFTHTDLLVQADYLHHDFTPDFGIGTYDNTKIPDVPIHNFYGTSWQYAKTRQSSVTLTVRHSFSEDWSLHTVASYQYYGRDYYSTERIQALANGDWARPLNKTNTKEQYFDAQVYLKGKLQTGHFSHNILSGIDADRYFTRAISFNQPLIYDTINIFNPFKYVARTDIPNTQKLRMLSTPVNRLGIYIQDLISVSDKIKVLAGVRWSWQNTLPVDTLNYSSGLHNKGKTDKTDKALSPRIGLLYKPTSSSSLFASYSNSFQ